MHTLPLILSRIAGLITLAMLPLPALASEGPTLDLTGSPYGLIALVVFVLAYILVISEEFLHLRKSKPVIIAAGIIWILVGVAYALHGDTETAEKAVRYNLMEYAELMLFLLAAMTYINTMDERQVFDALRGWLVSRGFSLRTIFWITGLLAFFISPLADNMTTALLMGAVALAVGRDNTKFVVVACINIVIAANAGGAFSPFGDITTLMVWQKGIVHFNDFFELFLPSVVSWLVPAFFMSFTVPKDRPQPLAVSIQVLPGGFMIIALFMFTIAMAVTLHNYLNLPPVLGMMTGLGVLKVYGYFLKRRGIQFSRSDLTQPGSDETLNDNTNAFDIYRLLARSEWDTLMFFYGVVLAVGGLGTIGYLAHASVLMYTNLGPTTANILVGILSAVVDNIPVMFAVLTMNPDMSLTQWLLVTLTAGIGGSLLSIGSAAGVALMGQARGIYTFFGHLRWSWAIGLGYAASVWLHLYLNS